MSAAKRAYPDAGPEVPQHMQALKRANEVRFEMAEAKKRIATGEVDPSEFFDVKQFGNLTVAEVLTSQRRWGETRMRKLLLSLQRLHNGRINLENVKICDLTLRERAALQAAIVEVRAGATGKKNTTKED